MQKAPGFRIGFPQSLLGTENVGLSSEVYRVFLGQILRGLRDFERRFFRLARENQPEMVEDFFLVNNLSAKRTGGGMPAMPKAPDSRVGGGN